MSYNGKELLNVMTDEQKARAAEMYDALVQAMQASKNYAAMTNDELADALINGPWADTPMFTQYSELIDAVVDRLRQDGLRSKLIRAHSQKGR